MVQTVIRDGIPMGRFSRFGFSLPGAAGSLLCFLGATSIGIGCYFAVWYAMCPSYYRTMAFAPSGTDWIVFPLFFGLGGLLWVIGSLHLKSSTDQAIAQAMRFLQEGGKARKAK